MKTDKNSQTTTTSGTLLQPEQVVQDSNQEQEFEAVFYMVEDSCNIVRIKAGSLDEATAIANEICHADLTDWEVFSSETHLESVTPVKGGQDHE